MNLGRVIALALLLVGSAGCDMPAPEPIMVQKAVARIEAHVEARIAYAPARWSVGPVEQYVAILEPEGSPAPPERSAAPQWTPGASEVIEPADTPASPGPSASPASDPATVDFAEVSPPHAPSHRPDDRPDMPATSERRNEVTPSPTPEPPAAAEPTPPETSSMRTRIYRPEIAWQVLPARPTLEMEIDPEVLPPGRSGILRATVSNRSSVALHDVRIRIRCDEPLRLGEVHGMLANAMRRETGEEWTTFYFPDPLGVEDRFTLEIDVHTRP